MHWRRTSKQVVTGLWIAIVCMGLALAQSDDGADSEDRLVSGTFSGLKLRSIGPALTSGRISDLAVDPADPARYFAAVASGGVWRTANAGTTWEPVFDGEGSYSIGCVTIDPNRPLTVWVGTGENNSQRSVGYGDGVYKSTDGGRTWTNMGLADSEHIGRIVVDPRDSDRVWVAAQGPLWASGGDRGLYLTTDGGASWELSLEIDEDTGVNEIWIDPRDPDVLYASAYQRRRHTWTLIDGGPGSGIYKTVDGGKNWTELTAGLPDVDMGRIGLAVSPVNPDVIYAIVEAQGDAGGVFRSTDAGASWNKRGDYMSSSPQYYNELVPDPHDVDRVYSMDTWMHVTEDGGKTWSKVPEKFKHVDSHALWIDPTDADHLLSGCDGGIYETWDRGQTWQFKPNLPIVQFYKATPDDDFPFYNVYGGTQDNATLGGPSRTTNLHGISNSDWYVTVFGDGFKTRVEPGNPDIVYSQYQYGGLARYDRKSGELLYIQPQPEPGDDPLRYNWDSALILSPHSPSRLYFGAQRLFRSDDRGSTWTPVSPDLTRNLDRNALEVMGRVWSVDAVAKNASTSYYGTIVALSESPLLPGLIYVGTDDGLVQITADGGHQWTRIDDVRGVPEGSYVNRIEASLHDVDTVYAVFNNHKQGDFRPYVLKSTNRGNSWKSIAGDLPERGSAYAIVEDHANPGLLFVGTEFGAYFTVDGGERWIELSAGLPTVAVRDLEIQRRENDLVLGTFGRGIYILDDYSPLREIDEAMLEQAARLFPVKKTWMYMQDAPLGLRGKAFQGDTYYTAENPPFGAIFSYYLKDGLLTLKEQRQKAEKTAIEEGEPIAYPDWEALRAEDREDKPTIVLTVRDSAGEVVRRLSGPVGSGIHRVAWDLRYPASDPIRLAPPPPGPFSSPPQGPQVVPGRYTVSLASRVQGEWTELAGPQEFEAAPLGTALLPAADRQALLAFQQKTARLQRAVLGAVRASREAHGRLDHLERAADETPAVSRELAARVPELRGQLRDLDLRLSGDGTVRRRNEPVPPSIVGRVQRIVGAQWGSSSAPTTTSRDAYRYAALAFEPVLSQLRRLIEVELVKLESELERAGAPWTPGRVPRWSRE